MRIRYKINVICLLLLPCYFIVGCCEKPQHNANWYYYWEKDSVVPYLNRMGSPASRWDWCIEAANQGAFGASHGPSDGFVLTDLCITSPVLSSILVRHKVTLMYISIGAPTQYGIEQAAATAAHERQHVLNWREIQSGNADTDGDGLADINEGSGSNYNFIINASTGKDTYNLAYYIHSTYATYGDNEVIARQAEFAGVAAVNLNNDWSQGGAQW